MEDFLKTKGFLNIDSLIGMWEMWIAVFVKSNIKKEIQDVKKHSLAKGKFDNSSNPK